MTQTIDKTLLIESSTEFERDPSITLNNISDSLFSFSSENALEYTTLENEIIFLKEQWSNVNLSNIYWRKINGKTKFFFYLKLILFNKIIKIIH